MIQEQRNVLKALNGLLEHSVVSSSNKLSCYAAVVADLSDDYET